MNEYDLIKKEISQIINNKYKCCVEVTGRWGIGKTFLIASILNNLNLNYKYISLMAYNDMSELKFDMSSTFGKLIKIGASLQTSINISEESQNFIGKKLLSLKSKFLNKEKDEILIFDDIERFAADRETLKSLFGYINSLKNNYKIIVILNNEEIYKNDDLKEIYIGLIDKLYDERYCLDIPPYKEFFKNFELDNKYINYVVEKVIDFDIKNLRNIRKSIQIFIKIERVIKKLNLKDEDKILESILEDLIIFVDADNENGIFSKYEKKIKKIKIGEPFFNSLFSKKYSFYNPDGDEEEKVMLEDDKKIVNLQNKYKLSNFRDITFIPSMYKYIKSGILDEEIFKKEILNVKTSFNFEITCFNLKSNLWGLNSSQFEEGMTNLIDNLNSNKIELEKYQEIIELINVLYEKKIYDVKEIEKINDKIIENLLSCNLDDKEYIKNIYLFDEFFVENGEIERNISPQKLKEAKKQLYVRVLIHNLKNNLNSNQEIKYIINAMNQLEINLQKEILNVIEPTIKDFTKKCIRDENLRKYYFVVRDNAFNLKDQFNFSKDLYLLFRKIYIPLSKKIYVKHGPVKYYSDNINELYK